MDALNNDFPSPSGQNYQTQARGRDDASSFFNPDRASRNLDGAGRASTAGYNRGSFFFAGREEPLKGGRDEEEEAGGGAWDIYADFNNTGPRYSTAFGSSPSTPVQTDAYVFYFEFRYILPYILSAISHWYRKKMLVPSVPLKWSLFLLWVQNGSGMSSGT